MSPRAATDGKVAQAKTAKAKTAAASASDAAASPIRVLLLDDETEHLDRTEEAIRSAWPFVAGPLRSAEVDLVLDRCEDVGAALEAVGTTGYDVVIADVFMPEDSPGAPLTDAGGALRLIRGLDGMPDEPLVVITTNKYSGVGAWLDEELRAQPSDAPWLLVVQKPTGLGSDDESVLLDTTTWKGLLCNAICRARDLRWRQGFATSELNRIARFSKALQSIRAREHDLRRAPLVFVEGPAGSGREMFARWMHELRTRPDEPAHWSILHTGGGHPPVQLRASLFGAAGQPGKLEEAGRGVVFVDPIDGSPQFGHALDRFVRDAVVTGRFLFGREGEPHDAREYAGALVVGMEDAVRVGDDRDLSDSWRSAIASRVVLPPVPELFDDLAGFAMDFINRRRRDRGVPLVEELAPEAIAALRGRPWPGNLKEIEGFLASLDERCFATRITGADVSAEIAMRGEAAVHAGAEVPALAASSEARAADPGYAEDWRLLIDAVDGRRKVRFTLRSSSGDVHFTSAGVTSPAIIAGLYKVNVRKAPGSGPELVLVRREPLDDLSVDMSDWARSLCLIAPVCGFGALHVEFVENEPRIVAKSVEGIQKKLQRAGLNDASGEARIRIEASKGGIEFSGRCECAEEIVVPVTRERFNDYRRTVNAIKDVEVAVNAIKDRAQKRP
ncbi:MAG: sigma 54-interacting transcriptional regulator [Coriobacteriia bacterium]|nr:sigma 54-interacting transcriptional regulator [Coriobacteriia bacterium]